MPDEYDELLRRLDIAARRKGVCLEGEAAAVIRKLREENEALREDFERYARHFSICEYEEWKMPPCSCGLDAAREIWAKKETT